MDDLHVVFRHNFSNHTSRDTHYLHSPSYLHYLREIFNATKQYEMETKQDHNLHDRGSKAPKTTATEVPEFGKEYFFSNIMVKVYQVPMMFVCTEEFAIQSRLTTFSSFIVIVFEHRVHKRRSAHGEREETELAIKA